MIYLLGFILSIIILYFIQLYKIKYNLILNILKDLIIIKDIYILNSTKLKQQYLLISRCSNLNNKNIDLSKIYATGTCVENNKLNEINNISDDPLTKEEIIIKWNLKL